MTNNLKPIYGINRQKSFYGKAKVLFTADGSKYLQSYDTIVAWIDKNGNQYKSWNGFSRTTLEHVKAFFERNISKKEWDSMEIVNYITGEVMPTNIDAQYRVYATSGFGNYKSEARFSEYAEAEALANRLSHGMWVSWVE